MFFYVYLAPEVISVAEQNGDLGLQVLISILRAFLQNCFLADFTDHRGRHALRRYIDDLPDSYDRKIMKELLVVLQKRNRFLYWLVPDYMADKSDIECVKEQANEAMLDLLLVEEPEDDLEHTETATLFNYQHTEFETNRARLASDGLTLPASSMDGNGFMDTFLKKGFRPANAIVICDGIFGKQYKGNYLFTATAFFAWLQGALIEPDACSVTIHCGEPDTDNGARDLNVMRGELGACRGRVSLNLQLYSTDQANFLPHQRYLLTSQFALSIDPGMDFLDPSNGRIRALSFAYKNMREVEKLIDSYKAGRTAKYEL